VDLPPGTGDEPLSIVQLLKADGALIITTPQDVALLDSRKTINFAKSLNTPVVGIIENMSGFICPHCGKEIDLFKRGGGEKASRDLDVPFLGTVPIEPEIVVSGDAGTPFILHDDGSEAKKSFESIVSKVENFFEKNTEEVK
jgi:Mrp family chromosome partitioning ATPase